MNPLDDGKEQTKAGASNLAPCPLMSSSSSSQAQQRNLVHHTTWTRKRENGPRSGGGSEAGSCGASLNQYTGVCFVRRFIFLAKEVNHCLNAVLWWLIGSEAGGEALIKSRRHYRHRPAYARRGPPLTPTDTGPTPPGQPDSILLPPCHPPLPLPHTPLPNQYSSKLGNSCVICHILHYFSRPRYEGSTGNFCLCECCSKISSVIFVFTCIRHHRKYENDTDYFRLVAHVIA